MTAIFLLFHFVILIGVQRGKRISHMRTANTPSSMRNLRVHSTVSHLWTWGKISITWGRARNQSENTCCCIFWQKKKKKKKKNLKFYAGQLLLTLKKKIFLQVIWPCYKIVEFCLVPGFTLSKIVACFSVVFILKTTWLTGIDFWIKVI